MWCAHYEAGCQCICCQVYIAESKLLMVSTSIDKVLEAGKLDVQMDNMMKAIQEKVNEECGVFM